MENTFQNMDYYRTFYYAAKLGSVSTAAKVLGVSQPAATMGIKNLEKQIGCPLFTRSSKGISLTQPGEILYQELIPAFEHIQNALDSIKRIQSLEEGVIRVGADGLVSMAMMERPAALFQEQFSGIKVYLSKLYLPEILRYLKDDMIDCAVLCTIQAPFDGHDVYQEEIRDSSFTRYPLTTLTDDFS